MRHNDSLEVIMGGREFGFAGHLEERPFAAPSRERDLSLELWVPSVLEFMQQVEGDIRLRNESPEAVEVDPNLEVGGGSVDLLVRRPADHFPKVYSPFGRACVRAEKQELAAGASLYQEIAPSFGLRHWFFDEPGTYEEVQANVRLADGRRLSSPVRRVRILRPTDATDRLAPDFFVNEVGMYLGVEGSRIDAMKRARDLTKEACERVPKAAVAQQIAAVNALRDARVFKTSERER